MSFDHRDRILWDVVADRVGLSGIRRDILSDFFRAALLEEFFKFTGFLLAKRSLKLGRKIDCMLIAGLIGLDTVIWLMDMESDLAQIAGGILILAMLTLGILYTVRTIKKVRMIARAAA